MSIVAGKGNKTRILERRRKTEKDRRNTRRTKDNKSSKQFNPVSMPPQVTTHRCPRCCHPRCDSNLASRQKVLPWDQNWILWHTNPTLDCELLPLSLTNILFKRAFKNRSVEACVTNLSHSTLIYRWPTRHPDKLDIHQ